MTICQWCHLEHWDELSRDRAGEQRAALYGATRVQDTQGTQGTHATGTLRHLSWVAWPLTQWEHAGAGHCVLRTTVTSSGDVCPPHRWFFSLMASTFAWLLCEISIILYIFIQHQVDPCVLHMDPSCGGACCCLLVCFPSGFLCVLASLSSRFQLESVFSTLPT